jgi:hypothetical protein
MKINFEYKGKKIVLVYDDNGRLEHIVDTETDKKMMIEYTQVGSGFEINMNNHNGYIPMKMCNAVYVRIMELDIFVPKFIYIPNVEYLTNEY